MVAHVAVAAHHRARKDVGECPDSRAGPDAGAWRVDVTGTGEVVEEPVETIALEKPRGAEAALIAIEEYREARRSARG